MTEVNTVPAIEANELTGPSVGVHAAVAPTIREFAIAPYKAGGLLFLTTALTLTSSAAVVSDVTALSLLFSRSTQTTESRLLGDEEGPGAKRIQRAILYRLRAAQFPRDEREQRIAKALATLRAANPLAGADRATWKWAAEEVDLEDV